MANLSITATDVKVVEVHGPLLQLPNGESLTKGMYARLSSTGTAEKGNGTTAGELGFGGIVCSEDGAATVSIMRNGVLDVGEALVSVAFGTKIYVSDTDALLADGADATVDRVVGYVVPGWGYTTADKLLYVEVGE